MSSETATPLFLQNNPQTRSNYRHIRKAQKELLHPELWQWCFAETPLSGLSIYEPGPLFRLSSQRHILKFSLVPRQKSSRRAWNASTLHWQTCFECGWVQRWRAEHNVLSWDMPLFLVHHETQGDQTKWAGWHESRAVGKTERQRASHQCLLPVGFHSLTLRLSERLKGSSKYLYGVVVIAVGQ